MTEILTGLLLLVGTLFVLLAAVGLLRMPDVYTRISAAAKANTLGVIASLLGAAVFFGEIGTTSRVLAIILFVFLTAPVAGHMIGRAAYVVGTPLWDRTRIDELKGHYEIQTRRAGTTAASYSAEEGIAPAGEPGSDA